MIKDALSTKFLDPDDKVRAAVCKVYSQLDYETALHHVSEAQLRVVAERGLDRKVFHIFVMIETHHLIQILAPCTRRGHELYRQTI